MLKQTILSLALAFGFNASAAKLVLKSHYTGDVIINGTNHDEILSSETLAYTNLTDGEYKLKIGDKFECTFAIKNDQDVRIDTRVIEGQTIRPIYNFLYGNVEGTEAALNEYKKLVNTESLDGVYAEINETLPQIKSMNSIVSKGLLSFTKASEKKYNGRVRFIFASSGKYRTYKDLKEDGDKFSGLRYSRTKKKWYKSSFEAKELHAVELIKFAKKENSKASLYLQAIMQLQINAYSEALATIAKIDSAYEDAFKKAIDDMKAGTAVFKIKDIQKPSFDLPHDFYDIIPDKTPESVREATKGFFTWLKGRADSTFFSKVFAKKHGLHKAIYLQVNDNFFDLEKRIQNDYLIGMWYQWQQKLVHNGGIAGKDKVHVVLYTDKPSITALVYFTKKDKNGNPKMEPTILR